MSDSKHVVSRTYGQVPTLPGRITRLGKLDIELTERCNNNCVHCCVNLPADDMNARSREVDTGRIVALLHGAAAMGCLTVRFTGGEPLLRQDFEEIYLAARKLGIRVIVFTNARLITPRLAELFARVPPLSPLEITVYGMHPESYEAVTRAPGSFSQFRRGVQLLLERKVPFIVKSVLLPHNRHEVNELDDWAATIPGMTDHAGVTVFLDLRNRRDDPQKNACIQSLRLSSLEILDVLTRNAAEYRRDKSAFASGFMGPAGDRLFTCGVGHGMCIDAYGRAQPCVSARAPHLTMNLFEKGSASWIGESGGAALAAALERFARFRDLRAANPEYLRRCARCFLKGLCGQCPARSWMEHGTLDTPVEYLCEASHAQARHLGWLGEGEHGWEVEDWRERVADSLGESPRR